VSALRFFFTVTLERPDLARRLTVIRHPRRLPAVLSIEEVALVLQAAPGPKYKAALATAYGAGLRVSEVVALRVGDVDSERMLLRVERGKGRKDRHAMLSPQLLELLRAWWREGRRLGVLLPRGWLFPGRNPVDPLSTRQLNRAVHAAAEAAGIKKRVSPLGHPRRSCRALRGLRPQPDRLQLLPQPSLPQVPGRGGAGLARCPRGRPAAGRLLPPGLHPAGRDRPDCLPEQGGALRPA